MALKIGIIHQSNDSSVSIENYKLYGAASRTLRKIDLPFLDAFQCASAYKGFNATIQICAGADKGRC